MNEYDPSAFTLIEPAPMSIACEIAVAVEHQHRATDVRDRGTVGALHEVQRAGDRRAFRNILRGLGRRRRRIVVEGDGERAGGGRAVRIGDRVGQAGVASAVSSFGPAACRTLSSSVTV